MSEEQEPTFELLNGAAAFAAKAEEMVKGAYTELALLTQDLDRRLYGSESFAGAIRKFVLQHSHAHLRILVNSPQVAIRNNPRLVEVVRALTSQIEFREVMAERRAVTPYEYLVADGRLLLFRETPMDLEAKYYGTSAHVARLQLKDFDTLWNESEPAQELRTLRL